MLAQEVREYSLADCREMAKAQNKQSQINDENVASAKALRQAAFANFFPKLSANAAYMWNEKDIKLLGEDAMLPVGIAGQDGKFTADPATSMKNEWGFVGGSMAGQTFKTYQDAAGAIMQSGDITQAQYLAPLAKAGDISSAFNPTTNPENIQWANYAYLPASAMTFDVEHMFVIQAGLIQPVFLGGKLRELYRIAKANEQIAKIKSKGNDDDIIVSVDEAYWRVVSVEEKLKLAVQYVGLLEQLEKDVEATVEEGLATKSDLLKVRVKLNEARMSQVQAINGLSLSKMALAQICGLPLDEDFKVDGEGLTEVTLEEKELNMAQVLDSRSELQLLEQANKIAKSGVKLAASTLQPNIMVSANYVWSNPNIFNGFEKKFDGFFNVGVVMNVPIAHVNDIFLLKAAKHKARTVELKLEESREKIELQATQSRDKVEEANMKLVMARANLENADENLRMAREGFDEGVISSTELMGAQTAWLQAHTQLIDTAIEARVCELYFLKHTGNL